MDERHPLAHPTVRRSGPPRHESGLERGLSTTKVPRSSRFPLKFRCLRFLTGASGCRGSESMSPHGWSCANAKRLPAQDPNCKGGSFVGVEPILASAAQKQAIGCSSTSKNSAASLAWTKVRRCVHRTTERRRISFSSGALTQDTPSGVPGEKRAGLRPANPGACHFSKYIQLRRGSEA
jgi:hypothetical protein